MPEGQHIEVIAEGLEKEDITGRAAGIDDERERDLALLIAGAMVGDIRIRHLMRQKLRGGDAGAGGVDLDWIALRGLRGEE